MRIWRSPAMSPCAAMFETHIAFDAHPGLLAASERAFACCARRPIV